MRRLFEPVDNSTLVLTRIGFGLVMAWHLALTITTGVAASRFQDPLLSFPLFGLEWLGRLPAPGMLVISWVALAASLCIAAGFAYRIAAPLFVALFGYLHVHDLGVYSNFDYLALLVGFWLALSPAEGAFSVDAKLFERVRSSTTPRLFPWALRFQIGIAYFYGGLIKFNPDWLGGEPVRTWLYAHGTDPIFGTMLMTEPMVMFFAYAGLVFDLTIALWLLLPQTRHFAVAAVAAFHLLNEHLFEVGVLPFFMIAMVVIFLPYDTFATLRSDRTEAVREHAGARRTALLALLSVWVVWQLLVPLRHLAYPGDGRWTYEGQRYSWWFRHATKSAKVDLWVTDRQTGTTTAIEPPDYLAPHQYGILTDPHLVVELAHAIKRRDFADDDVSIHADVRCSLNQRPWQQLIPSDIDLLQQPRGVFVHYNWVVPLGEQLVDPPDDASL